VTSVLEAAVSAELVIHYQSSNSFPRTEKCQETENYAMRYLSRLWQVCSMKLHGVLQMHETVCRLIICPVQLSPKFPAGCFSPKPTLSAPSSKPSLAPLPRLPLLVIPPQTHTGCLCHNTHTGTPCHHPHSGCPFSKNLSLFSAIRSLSLCSHFPPQSFRTDRRLWTSPSARAVSATKPEI